MHAIEVRLTERGYLHLSAEVAARYFPNDLLAVLSRDGEMWLLPTRGAGAGGLVLNRRDPDGNRSVLVHHLVPELRPGRLVARWDETRGALRVPLTEA